MKASKVLVLGTVGIAAALLIVGVVAAAGPNEASDNRGLTSWLRDNGHEPSDYGCHGNAFHGGECNHDCDGSMCQERKCLQDGTCGDGLPRSMNDCGRHRH